MGSSIQECDASLCGDAPQAMLADAMAAARPLVLRGLCRDWPLVQHARRSPSEFAKALAALLSTARYLGLGLGSVVNAIDPAHVYIGGEITAAWDLIEASVRSGLAERALTPPAGATPITIVPPEQYPRLRGAAALVAAPAFASGAVA
jgi:predicted NBD/HSP70 family sugar kinase